jgi:hypothetical protein
MALLFGAAWAQDKTGNPPEAPSKQITPPHGEETKDTRVPWRSIIPPDVVKSTDSTETLFADRRPFPPKGFAEGVVVVLGEDTGEPGTYRMAFKWKANGQEFPLIECRQLQAFEDKILSLGRDARHGKTTVEVKGTVTQYRGMNFLLLSDFRLPRLPYGVGGTTPSEGLQEK